MASWGKRKDGQSYRKDKPSGTKRKGTTIAGGKKIPPIIQHKKTESHLYRIYQYESSEYDNDREEIAHIRAKDIDQAAEFVKKKYFAKSVKPEDIDDDWGGFDNSTTVSVSYAVNENGGRMHQKTIDRLQDAGEDDDINWITEGFQIEQDDDEKDDFETIQGGNDFFDITGDSVITRGMTTEQAMHQKKDGFAEATFFGINRINQKIHETAIREKYSKKMDEINDIKEIQEPEKKLMLRTLENMMKKEIKEIGRIPMNEIDYGKGDGVR